MNFALSVVATIRIIVASLYKDENILDNEQWLEEIEFAMKLKQNLIIDRIKNTLINVISSSQTSLIRDDFDEVIDVAIEFVFHNK